MWLDKRTAFRIEQANAKSHLLMARSYGDHLCLSSGYAFYCGNESFFSQVVGWGFDAKVSEIDTIEAFYQSHGMSTVNIELCSVDSIDAINFLNEKGYKVAEVNNISIMDDFSHSSEARTKSHISSASNETDACASIVAEGFELTSKQVLDVKNYFSLNDVHIFIALHEEKVAGGGSVTIHKDIADFGVTSVLPKYRGLGLQKDLLYARLKYAHQCKIRQAFVITEPGSVSDNNVRRVGFKTLYSRIKFEKTIG